MRLRSNFFYNAFLTCSNYLFQIITYPYVSRVLGVENIGICNFVTSIVQYTLLFATLGIAILGIREVARCKNDQQQLSCCFSSLFLLNSITTIVVLVIYLVVIAFIPALYAYRKLLYIGAIQIISNLFLVEWFFKGIENFKYITIRSLVVRITYVIGVFLLVKSPDDYTLYYSLTVGMVLLNGLINWKCRGKYIKFSIKQVAIKQYIYPNIIMGLYLILTSMYTSFNVLFLGFVGGETEVGYYTTASKLYSVILGLFTAFTGVMLPRISNLVEQHAVDQIKHLCHTSFGLLFAFAIPLILFSTLFAPQLIFLLSGPGYEGAIIPMRIIMPLVLIIGIEQILVVQILMAHKQDKAVLTNAVFGALVALSSNIILVPHFFSIGSGVVWLISELAVFISSYYFVNRFIQGIFPWKLLGKNIILTLPLLAFYFIMVCCDYTSYIFLAISAFLSVLYVFCIQTTIVKEPVIKDILCKILCRLSHRKSNS